MDRTAWLGDRTGRFNSQSIGVPARPTKPHETPLSSSVASRPVRYETGAAGDRPQTCRARPFGRSQPPNASQGARRRMYAVGAGGGARRVCVFAREYLFRGHMCARGASATGGANRRARRGNIVRLS